MKRRQRKRRLARRRQGYHDGVTGKPAASKDAIYQLGWRLGHLHRRHNLGDTPDA